MVSELTPPLAHGSRSPLEKIILLAVERAGKKYAQYDINIVTTHFSEVSVLYFYNNFFKAVITFSVWKLKVRFKHFISNLRFSKSNEVQVLFCQNVTSDSKILK